MGGQSQRWSSHNFEKTSVWQKPRKAKMSSENQNVEMPESEETKLTLGLPGDRCAKWGLKRGFSGTIDLNIGGSSEDDHGGDDHDDDGGHIHVRSSETKAPEAKAHVVGWPPVRVSRIKNVKKSCKYVKVAVDGAPYLRKVDLQMYNSYHQLFTALDHMFSCFTIRNNLNYERKMMMEPPSAAANGMEYVPTYEDKDGDWMLVGDVPWKMFVESCKRLRLMKSSDAIGLAPSTPPKRTSTTSKKPL